MEILSEMLRWLKLHPDLQAGLAIFSLAAFFGTLLLLPLLIIRIPEDYFLDRPAGDGQRPRRSLASLLIFAGRNLAGGVLVLAGIAMLLLPGQGLLSILVGLMLAEFPGKRKLELKFVRRKGVLFVINRIRASAGKPPVKVESYRP